jgi:hypothetical protein
VRVAEGVDLKRADVGGEEHEVLRGGGEHVPGLEVEEGHHEVEAYCGGGGDDEVGEDVVSEFDSVGGFLELKYDDVDTCECVVGHYYGVDYHGGEVEFLCTLWAVAHAEDELRAYEENERVAEENKEVEAYIVSERVDNRVRERASYEVEGQIEVGEGEVGEGEVNGLVEEFYVQKDFAANGMVCCPDLAVMDKGIDGCKEGTIEPSSTLRNEFGDGVWEC